MGAPSCATSSSVFVTNGKPRKGQPMRGSDNSLSAGCLRGPSPIGVIQRWAPDFRSIAVMRPYGGLVSGRPWGPRTACRTRRCRANRAGESDCRGLLSGPAKGIVIDGTYRIPVSGSNASPEQLAPPLAAGLMMAPGIEHGDGDLPCL